MSLSLSAHCPINQAADLTATAGKAAMKWLLGLLALLYVGGARCGCPFSRTRVEYAWAHEAETGKFAGT